ncbi:TonB-dependent siderophore receptor [Oxalobacteraceae bacterium CAVE-383]|nr:TonB-dependent siderophore receptor [Oxalobacteraceae bacterium CAVE-383]
MNRLTPIAAALLAVFASPVHAQQAAPASASATASSSPTVMENVTVTGNREDFSSPTVSVTKLPADLHDVPQSVVVVNKALLESRGATSLTDALRNVSGITIGGAEGGQIGNNINLNGFSARTDIYLDGFRDRGQYYRDTFALEQVEVLMGPSSMLFGRGSTGGIINQVSKKANLKQSSEVSASVTTNGLVRTTADYNQPLNDTSAVRISAMAQKGAATTRDQSDVEDYGLQATFSTGIGTPTEITLSALIQHNHDQPDYGLPALNGAPVNVGRNTAYGLDSDRTNSDVVALNGTIKHKLSENTTFRNMTQFNYVHTDARETAPQSIGTIAGGIFTPVTTTTLPLSSLFVRGQTHDRILTDYAISNQSELTSKFDFGGFRHDALLGLELGHEGYNNQTSNRFGDCPIAGTPATNQSFIGCTPLVNPSYSAFSSNLPSTPYNLASGSANTIAVYGGDTVALNDQFKLVGGLREDRYIASISNSIPSATVVANANQTINFLSVRAGGIWQPTSAQAYYLSYGTSFNPSLEQLTGTVGQTSLDPEKNKSYELGGKWDISEDLAANASIFQITKENARSLVSTGVYSLDGTVRVRGAALGATGRLSKRWQITGNYTYLMAQVTKAAAGDTTLGKVPVNVPKHAFTGWTTYRLTKDWEIGGGPTYQSGRYANPANSVAVGAYTRWDAMIAYTQPKYDVRLNLFNLTDKMYYDALIQSDGGRSVPGSGRTALLSVNYRM